MSNPFDSDSDDAAPTAPTGAPPRTNPFDESDDEVDTTAPPPSKPNPPPTKSDPKPKPSPRSDPPKGYQSGSSAPGPVAGSDDLESGSIRERTRLEVQEEYVPCFFRYVTVIARVSGIITCVVLWIITGNIIHDKSSPTNREGYMIFLSTFITVFESLWIFNVCFSKIKDEGSCICSCWRIVIWFDNWKKCIIYVGITIPCLISQIINTLTIVAAAMVITTAYFYGVKSCQYSKCVRKRRTKYITETTT